METVSTTDALVAPESGCGVQFAFHSEVSANDESNEDEQGTNECVDREIFGGFDKEGCVGFRKEHDGHDQDRRDKDEEEDKLSNPQIMRHRYQRN